MASLAAGLLLALVAGLVGVTWQWRQAVANLAAAESANRKAQARFDLAMEAVRAFTTGASEDVILKEKALEGLRKKLLGQSRLFYERLRRRWRGRPTGPRGRRWPRRCSTRGRSTPRSTRRRRRWRRTARRWRCARRWCGSSPGDPAAQRDLGRSHLALAELLGSRLESTRRGPSWPGRGRARAAGPGAPRRRRRPAAGGRVRFARREAAPQSAGPPRGGQRWSERRALYEDLIRDNPPYTLPTAADGPTEYRRGLAAVLDRLGM